MPSCQNCAVGAHGVRPSTTERGAARKRNCAQAFKEYALLQSGLFPDRGAVQVQTKGARNSSDPRGRGQKDGIATGQSYTPRACSRTQAKRNSRVCGVLEKATSQEFETTHS